MCEEAVVRRNAAYALGRLFQHGGAQLLIHHPMLSKVIPLYSMRGYPLWTCRLGFFRVTGARMSWALLVNLALQACTQSCSRPPQRHGCSAVRFHSYVGFKKLRASDAHLLLLERHRDDASRVMTLVYFLSGAMSLSMHSPRLSLLGQDAFLWIALCATRLCGFLEALNRFCQILYTIDMWTSYFCLMTRPSGIHRIVIVDAIPGKLMQILTGQ